MKIDEMITTEKRLLIVEQILLVKKKKKLLSAEQILLVRRQRKKYGEYAYIIMLECKGLKTDNRECMCID